jgi:hypothetical protein
MNDLNLLKSIDALREESFGSGSHFIVDSTHALPTGRPIRYALCMTDITGFSALDRSLEEGSGNFPSAFVAGIELPSNIQNITVTNGSIFCIFK